MAVPKRKVSPSRRGKRRSGHSLSASLWSEDKNGDLHRPHHMTLTTGEWRGRVILPPKVKAEKSEAEEEK